MNLPEKWFHLPYSIQKRLVDGCCAYLVLFPNETLAEAIDRVLRNPILDDNSGAVQDVYSLLATTDYFDITVREELNKTREELRQLEQLFL